VVNLLFCFIWDMERKGKKILGASALVFIGMSTAACSEAQNPSPMEATDTPQTNVYEAEPDTSPTQEDVKRSDLLIQTYPTFVPTEIFIEPTFEASENSEIVNILFDPNQTIAVIEHHNPSYGVNDGEYGPVYMTREIYEAQLQYLKDNGFYTPSEQELLGWLEGKHGLPKKSVIIRIDIGLPKKDYEVGFQLLEKYGFRAILFILTTHIPDQSTEDRLGWDKIREYVSREVLIPGSHGTNHPDYSEISENEAKWDALNSKQIIEEKLGRKIYFFAYPYDSEGHEAILLEHFKMLFGAYSNKAEAGNPLVGTRYPYIRGVSFDWEKFEYELFEGIGDQ